MADERPDPVPTPRDVYEQCGYKWRDGWNSHTCYRLKSHLERPLDLQDTDSHITKHVCMCDQYKYEVLAPPRKDQHGTPEAPRH